MEPKLVDIIKLEDQFDLKVDTIMSYAMDAANRHSDMIGYSIDYIQEVHPSLVIGDVRLYTFEVYGYDLDWITGDENAT